MQAEWHDMSFCSSSAKSMGQDESEHNCSVMPSLTPVCESLEVLGMLRQGRPAGVQQKKTHACIVRKKQG